MSAFLDRAFLGNSVRDWLFAAAAFLVIFTVLPLVRGFVLSRRAKLEALGRGAAGVELALLLISRTSQLFLWIVALFFAGRFLESTSRIEQASKLLIVIVTWFQVARWGTTAVRFALERQQLKHEAAGDAGFRGSIGIVMFVANLAIFSVAILLALDNLGVNITALVAGLGVGGVAVALALQNILGDLFSSIAIGLDKPFVLGDFIIFGEAKGTVTRIGVKTTRLQSLSGELLVVSNSELLKQLIRNYTRMQERRIASTFRVSYGASREQVQRIVDGTRAAIEADARARLDRVHLAGFAESGLEFELVYFVRSPDYTVYMDVQQGINLRIMGLLEDVGVALAVPVRQLVKTAD